MKLYQFLLPVYTNDRRDNYERAQRTWLVRALAVAGGYTVLPNVEGAWRDGATVYKEPMTPVNIAGDESHVALLTTEFFERFPDQAAVMVSEIGAATITSRPAMVAA